MWSKVKTFFKNLRLKLTGHHVVAYNKGEPVWLHKSDIPEIGVGDIEWFYWIKPQKPDGHYWPMAKDIVRNPNSKEKVKIAPGVHNEETNEYIVEPLKEYEE